MDTRPTIVPIPPPSKEEWARGTEFCRIISSYTTLVISDPDNLEIATAVMLRVGHRLFAVTAEHCVTKNMWVTFRRSNGRQDGRLAILRELIHDNLDVAVLEVENHLEVRACSLGQMSPLDNSVGSHEFFWIAGFPVELAHYENGNLSPKGAVFGTNLLVCTEDVLSLHYPENGYKGTGLDSPVPESRSNLPTTPKGISGGGIWYQPMTDNSTFFDPSKHVRLIGIQYAWKPDTRILKAVPAKIVVDMLRELYPDIETEPDE